MVVSVGGLPRGEEGGLGWCRRDAAALVRSVSACSVRRCLASWRAFQS